MSTSVVETATVSRVHSSYKLAGRGGTENVFNVTPHRKVQGC